mmetsp:Transcript_3912/g.9801  ORF Transcript_3912/g.9801 Transcript_3912/m.9801 type:complete len:227 (+) Transcript_3912:905-1585(+)
MATMLERWEARLHPSQKDVFLMGAGSIGLGLLLLAVAAVITTKYEIEAAIAMATGASVPRGGDGAVVVGSFAEVPESACAVSLATTVAQKALGLFETREPVEIARYGMADDGLVLRATSRAVSVSLGKALSHSFTYALAVHGERPCKVQVVFGFPPVRHRSAMAGDALSVMVLVNGTAVDMPLFVPDAGRAHAYLRALPAGTTARSQAVEHVELSYTAGDDKGGIQ